MTLNLNWAREVGLSGSLDILFMWFVIYALLVWSKRTRIASVLTGILIVAGVYLLTRQFNMTLASGLLEKFFAIILIALVIIFQEELRYGFEKIAEWSLRRRLKLKSSEMPSRHEVGVIVKTLTDLSKVKTGALIVIRGKDLIARHLGGGIELGGSISEALLKSLFDSSSIGHDGAVYIEGDEVVKFSCHLPLSKDSSKLGAGGTRHAAALGLSELCDAMCLVVSEERGTISIARHGSLTPISDPSQLKKSIDQFYNDINPKIKTKPWEGFFKKNSREKGIGLILACLIWFVLVFGAKHTYKTFTVPISYLPLPAPMQVTEVNPNKVYVTLGGPRNAFFFFDSKKIKLNLNLDAREGVRTVRLYPTHFEFPKDLAMEVLAPQEIEIRIDGTVEVEEEKEKEKEKRLSILGTVKKVLPLVKNGEKTRESEKERMLESKKENGIVETEKLSVEKVESLEDARPEEVVEFLEKTLETKEPIQPLVSEEPALDNQKETI